MNKNVVSLVPCTHSYWDISFQPVKILLKLTVQAIWQVYHWLIYCLQHIVFLKSQLNHFLDLENNAK